MLANSDSWGVVFNSFTELERVYIDHIKMEMGHHRVWACSKPAGGTFATTVRTRDFCCRGS
ncbi:hypothetical protein HYC85_030042 [Camellia sinensis]|uniref:Uncharacterized protein n=1 Tax=Camellia sinensis TaxID=4442 RepID=A0A7J7G100_CAMSI|nr:hypothetical protein HYC85_030042 [Camellia sinensis]